jgi:hypothetical protein
VFTIFTFIGNCNSFFWPLVLRRVQNYALPVGLLFFDSTRGQATHLLMAVVTMSSDDHPVCDVSEISGEGDPAWIGEQVDSLRHIHDG